METKVLSIDVKEAVDRLAKLTRQIELLTAQNAELKKEIKELNAAGQAEIENARAKSAEFEKNHKAISILTAQRRVLRRELENSIRQNTEEVGSLRALRAEVSRLTSVYDSLSRVRREGAEGKALLEQIQKTTKELNMAEQASLRFQRNVGNYQSAFGNLHFQVQQLARELPSLSYGFNVFVGAISNNLPMLVDEIVRARREYDLMMKTDPSKAVPVWKQLFSAVFNWQTALVAGITILTMYGREIGNWIEELINGKKAVEGLEDALKNVNDALLENAGGYGDSIAKFKLFQAEWAKLSGNIEGQKKLLKENKSLFDDLGISVDNVTEAEKAAVTMAPKIAEAIMLKAEATAAYNLMVEAETRAMQTRANAEKQMVTTNVWDYLNAGIDVIMNLDAAIQGINVWDPEKYAKGRGGALLFDAEKAEKEANAYKEVALKKQEEIREKLKDFKPATDNADKVRDMKAVELAEYRKAEDELLKLVKDARAREYKEMEFSYARQIEDLKARLETEKDLSVDARKAINDQIAALEKQRANKRIELSEEALQDEIKAKQTEIEAQLELIEEGTQAEFDIKRQALTDLEALELKSVELTEAQKEEIRKRYAKQRADLDAEENRLIAEREVAAMKARFDLEFAELESQQYKKLDLIIKEGANEDQIKQAQTASEIEFLKLQHSQQLEALRSMKQEENETEAEFNARKAEQQAAADETQMQLTQTKAQMMRDSYQSIADGLEALGEQSESFAKLSKVLALAEIAYNTGKALAAGIASAAAQPFPANLAAIATTVGTVLANMAQATKIVNSFKSKGEDKPRKKFATGGLVEGPGTETSDSIPAMLSNGESVLTARATSMFAPVLSAFNQIGGGIPIQATETANSVAGEEMLARAFMQGAAALPSPVVSVVDINAGQTRVAQIEALSNL